MKKLFSTLATVLLFASLVFAQGKMAAGITGGVALPFGDFGKMYKTGFGANATYFYSLTNCIDLTGSFGFFTWTAKDYDDASFRSMPFLVGGRYYFEAGKLRPYVAAELGLHFLSIKVTIPSVSVGGMTFGGGTQSESSSKLGFGGGAGLLYPVNENLDIDFNAKMNVVTTEGSSSTFLTVLAGVRFGF